MSTPSRRTVLQGLAVGGCALPLLTACGVGSGSSGGSGPIRTREIPVGGGAIFSDRQVVVTQPAKGTFKAFSSICTHAGCTVGQVAGGTIDCPCHGSEFSIKDGSVVRGPATQPLPEKKLTVEGATIRVG
ncbi:MAG TPA: Rieske (2Fe-2S) protein [Marmoricola sp.]|nr:Rieske (2Fe-2S) protein [Marmoricola sp.]